MFRGITAFYDNSFGVSPGETGGLIGPNGLVKSIRLVQGEVMS